MTAADDLRVAREQYLRVAREELRRLLALDLAPDAMLTDDFPENLLRAIEALIDAKIAEQLGGRIEDAIKDAARWRLFRPSIFGS